jgi:AcrR family transcriptional regulator
MSDNSMHAPASKDRELVKDAAVAALLALLAEKPFDEIELGAIAASADLSLADLRNHFGSTGAILAAFMKDIDRQVLAGGGGDMAEEPPRERLFDVLMRRLEALAPHRPAIRSLARTALRNPAFAIALNILSVRSQQWMLTAADIPASGPKGMVRAQGLALLFASVLRTWLDDQDPGLARTMAALDRALARGQQWVGLMDNLCAIPASLARGRTRHARPSEDSETATA